MNYKEKSEIWKRKQVKLESKVGKLNDYRNILINLLNEAKNRQNIKLNYLLKGIDLQEEISHLTGWSEFHEEKITGYKNKIEKKMLKQ